MVGLALYLSLTATFAIWLGVTNWGEYYRLANAGRQVRGRVVSKEADNHQAVRYSYVVDNKIYTAVGRAGNGNPRFEDLAVGEVVSVTYLPTDPAKSALGNPSRLLRHETRSALGAAVLLPAVVVWPIIWWWGRGQRRRPGWLERRILGDLAKPPS
jgi:hypothetical protein